MFLIGLINLLVLQALMWYEPMQLTSLRNNGPGGHVKTVHWCLTHSRNKKPQCIDKNYEYNFSILVQSYKGLWAG